MSRAVFTRICALVALAGAVTRSAPARDLGLARIPVSYRAWTLDPRGPGRSSRLSELHVPVLSEVHLGPGADLRVRAAAASSRLEPSTGDEVTLGGMTDVSSTLLLRLAGDRLLLQAGVNLPAGDATLDPSELDLSRVLGEPLLGFPLREFGSGFDLELALASALPVGDHLLLGFGGGTVQRGDYTLLEGAGAYDPGDETSAVAGIDWAPASGDESPCRLDLAYRTYTSDELRGRRVFAEGDQLEGQLEFTFQVGGARLNLVARAAQKADNISYGAAGDSVASVKASPGTQTFLALRVERPLTDRLRAGVAGEWARHAGSDPLLVAGKAPARDGDAAVAALLAGFRVVDSVDLSLRAEWLRGAFGGDDLGDVDLRGFGIGGALTFAP